MKTKASATTTATAEVVDFPRKFIPPEDRRVKNQLDRTTAAALVEAGYMSYNRYVELYG